MSQYLFNNIPGEYFDKFRPVRDVFSNLENLLVIAEIVNTCHSSWNKKTNDFDLLITTGTHKRILIRKPDGFFTMNLPFQVIEFEENISFNYDAYGLAVNAEFISRCRNVITTCDNGFFSHEAIAVDLCDNFDGDMQQAIHYSDAISALLLLDHGYFRFDDDPIRVNGKIHPRYHFDFFCN
ncbi:TPA: hypothetical protein NPN60_005078, partial [Klebsiella pneumoniae]|nr:hypothetical protein [Klebsiella pneumoniae]